MSDSRTKNTTRNIMAGLLNRGVSTVLPFVNRTILIYTLGAEFAGLSSLFLSILSVLSLAELGFNSAVVYSMYEPVAKGDAYTVRKLLTLYKRIYLWVGTAILGGGLVLVPFLPYLIHGEIPDSVNLYVLYFLYLANTVVSYFMFAYRESLLLAHQRRDISDIIRTGVLLCQYLLQMVVLLIWKNFYVYLCINILCTIVTNCWIALKTKRMYPEYSCLKEKKIPVPEKIKSMVKALLIGNICDQARNSFDSVILSTLLGLTAVAVYNNYYFVYSALYGIMLTICNALGASVGNSMATETVEKNYNDLQKFSFMTAWISGWMTVCMLCLYQPFMRLWVGPSLLLPERDMILFCVYFYAINMNNIRNQYINGSGLWDHLKLTYALEAIANIVLNVVLGKLFGITGIILATILTIFFSNFIWRTCILFKTYFKTVSLKRYLCENALWAVGVIGAAALTYWVCNQIHLNDFATLLTNGMICILLPNALLYLLFARTATFKEAKKFIEKMVKHS